MVDPLRLVRGLDRSERRKLEVAAAVVRHEHQVDVRRPFSAICTGWKLPGPTRRDMADNRSAVVTDRGLPPEPASIADAHAALDRQPPH